MFSIHYVYYYLCSFYRKGLISMMIRTIDKAYDEIKARDPGTAISRELVRQMVKTGMVPSLSTGNRKLVDVDVLQEHVEKITGRYREEREEER